MDPMIAATIGNFDGVHRGHLFLLNELLEQAQTHNLSPRVITFDPSPRTVLKPDRTYGVLTTREEKSTLIRKAIGFDPIVLPFTHELATLSARDFIHRILRQKFNVRLLVVGFDHRFGHRREEGFEDYVRYGQDVGLDVVEATAFSLADEDLSSSTIRKTIEKGQIEEANQYLGYTYTLTGTVKSGFRIGRLLGYPTANIEPNDSRKLIPQDGVYAVRCLIGGRSYGGMLYTGHRPTVGDGLDRSIEVNIFDLDADLYGESISVEFIAYTRNDTHFASFDELVAQIHRDELTCRQVLAQNEGLQ